MDARDLDSRLADLRSLYDGATFGGDESAIARSEEVLSSLEADLSMARGRLAHARFLAGSERAEADRGELAQFQRGAELYGSVADERGLAEALLWIGIAHQVVSGNLEAASEPLHRISVARAVAVDVRVPDALGARSEHPRYFECGCLS